MTDGSSPKTLSGSICEKARSRPPRCADSRSRAALRVRLRLAMRTNILPPEE